MKIWAVFANFCTLLLSFFPLPTYGIEFGSIIPQNGLETTEDDHAMVGIFVRDDKKPSQGMYCSGTLIAADMVLTAAHCVEYGRETNVVFSNDMALVLKDWASENDPNFMRKADKIAKRPKDLGAYSPINYDLPDVESSVTNDIAVVRFSGPLPSGYEIAKVLADSNAVKVGEAISFAGYGYDENGKNLGTLQGADSKVFNLTNAAPDKHSFSSTVPIMFGFAEIAEWNGSRYVTAPGLSLGDSGGPLFINSGGVVFLAGVNVYIRDSVDYSVSVAPYFQWIFNEASRLRNIK